METAALVVATFNIRTARALDGRHSWPLRRAVTAAAIEALDADVVGVQEAYRRPLRYLGCRALSGYEVVGEGRDGGRRGEHCAIASRAARLEHRSDRTRWFGEVVDRPNRMPGARTPRIATIARYVDRAADRTLAVVNLHLDEKLEERRARCVGQLVGWLTEWPDDGLVVMGDFNTDDRTTLAPLRDAGLRAALGADAPGTSSGFAGRTDGRRLDHVFLGGALTVVSARVDTLRPHGRMPSDHWPVRVEVVWDGAP